MKPNLKAQKIIDLKDKKSVIINSNNDNASNDDYDHSDDYG
jgi:hypothetical protein